MMKCLPPSQLFRVSTMAEGVLHSFSSLSVSSCDQGLVCEEDSGRGGLWRFAVLSEELTFHLQQLQRQTEQELCNIHTQWVNDLLCSWYKEVTVYCVMRGHTKPQCLCNNLFAPSCQQAGCLLRVCSVWRMDFSLITQPRCPLQIIYNTDTIKTP